MSLMTDGAIIERQRKEIKRLGKLNTKLAVRVVKYKNRNEKLEAVVDAARPVSELGMWATPEQNIALSDALAALDE